MNYKLKGRTLLNGDIISPEIPIAEFSDALAKGESGRIVAHLNAGWKMLLAYEAGRDSLHIKDAVTLLDKLESIYQEYEGEMQKVRRLK